MTPAEWAAETRRRQGLPEHLEDEAVLAELAGLVLEPAEAEAERGDAA